MSTIVKPRTLGIVLSVVLWCPGATADSILPQIPTGVAMNKDAGRGGHLMVTLWSENGEKLPFIVDTGSPVTLFDKSMEPELGNRLGTGTCWNFGAKHKTGIYAAPKLYLENTPLMTGSNIWSFNFKHLSFLSGRRIMGILGMDCLHHYCIQLDFKAGKLRFLDPEQVNTADLGKAFPLTFSSEGQSENELIRPFIHHLGLFGGKGTNSLVDTGFNTDGQVEKGVIKGHWLTRAIHFLVRSRALRLPECVWDGESYTHLNVNVGENANILGLRFLARHLVTLDFPKQTMYLKQTNTGPLSSGKPL